VGPSNRRIRTRAPRLQSNGEAGNDRNHKLVAPLTMARQPANLVRMPFSTPATLAQACRRLTILRTHCVVSSCAISFVAFAFDPKPKAILLLGVINQASAKEVLPWLIAKANDRLDTRAFEAEGEKATIRRNPNDINKHISPACEKLEAGAAHFITEEMKLRPSRARKLSQVA